MILVLLGVLLIGFYLLFKGAGFLVDGAVGIAKKFGVPEFVIAVTLIALGTSLPELFVNIMATFANKPDIIFGNILGSNMANLCLILGISGLVYPVFISKKILVRDLLQSILAILVLLVLCFNFVVFDGFVGLNFWKSLVLMSFFGWFLYLIFMDKESSENELNRKDENLWKLAGVLGLGILLLPIGAKFVVDSAVYIARALKVSEAFISILLIAFGTSLPELITSLVAIYRKKHEIAVGNIIGSNIFNILFVLGMVGLIKPIRFNSVFIFDGVFLILASLFLFLILYFSKKKILSKWGSGGLLIFYVIYVLVSYMGK